MIASKHRVAGRVEFLLGVEEVLVGAWDLKGHPTLNVQNQLYKRQMTPHTYIVMSQCSCWEIIDQQIHKFPVHSNTTGSRWVSLLNIGILRPLSRERRHIQLKCLDRYALARLMWLDCSLGISRDKSCIRHLVDAEEMSCSVCWNSYARRCPVGAPELHQTRSSPQSTFASSVKASHTSVRVM